MLIRRPPDIPSSEITPESVYLRRREILRGMGVIGAAVTAPGAFALPVHRQQPPSHRGPDWLEAGIQAAEQGPWQAEDELTPFEYVSQYNNFYEFGTGKDDPAANAQNFRTDPWSLTVSGECAKPGTLALEDFVKPHAMEERVYRFRCVEAWSMVVPWIGVPLGKLLARFEPTSNAKYVRFKTLFDPEQMPDQRSRFRAIDYPYVEGLRIDEAMHPLTLMVTGVYGQVLPPQNGAPLRLMVPWKYGFKSIKSIVSIEFLRRQPKTTWESQNSREYGFYANVNPEVDHPRWSQATERRLPSTLFNPNRIKTQMFNGYAEDVAPLYAGMNLRRNY